MRAEDGSTVNSNFYSKLGPGIYRGADGQLHRGQAPKPISRRLEQEARRVADHQSDRLREKPPPVFYATVSSVSAGGSRDGNALVAVRWRGAEVTVAGYAASYTPVVGHRVVCMTIDNQIEISHRSIGHP